MGTGKIDSATTTNMTANVPDYSIADAETEEIFYTPNWAKWKGYYDVIPEVQAVINKKAEYVIGKGYKVKKASPKDAQIKRIRGCGIDTFNSVIRNLYTQANICGDGFAEIIKDSAGRISNLKPLCPETMTIIANKAGIIIKYVQTLEDKDTHKKKEISFKPSQIFHLTRNRIGSAIHGISCLEAVENIILARNEAMADLKIVFHRYVKPLLIAVVDTDDTQEIAKFKVKMDNAVKYAENMIIPKDTCDRIDRVSIPQYSTLDPLPWIKELQTFFTIALGVPEVIQGSGRETTEASSKILYVAFQQTIENDQFVLEEQIEIQLGFEINFEFPASLLDAVQQDNKKDSKINTERKSEIIPSKEKLK